MRYINRVMGPSSSRAIEQQSSQPSVEEKANGEEHVTYTPSFAPLKEYITAVIGVAALTVACWLVTPLTGYGSISLIFLLGVLLAGMVLNRGPVLLVAALSALSWNFLFIPPLFTLHCRQLDCAVEGPRTPRGSSTAGARIRAASQNTAGLRVARIEDAARGDRRRKSGTLASRGEHPGFTSA